VTGRHARVVYDLDAPIFPQPDADGIYRDAHDTFGTRRGVVYLDAVSAYPVELVDEAPSADVCPIHGAGCEAWA
jgi:hypothetical protein